MIKTGKSLYILFKELDFIIGILPKIMASHARCVSKPTPDGASTNLNLD